MKTARMADDPRPYFDNYARSHDVDFVEGLRPQPWAPVGSFAPVGGTLATIKDMAAYISLQVNEGVALDGTRAVSAENLAECWQPHIDAATSPELDPDLVRAGYGMGGIGQTYHDRRSMTWHNGAMDRFTAFIGFTSNEDVGVVVLCNLGPFSGGLCFYPYVTNLLLSSQFGINATVNPKLLVQAQAQASAQSAQLKGSQAAQVDSSPIEPYLGFYERGYELTFDESRVLRLRQRSRSIRVMVMPDGSYVMAGGFLSGLPIFLSADSEGNRLMELKGIETAKWSSGPR